MQDNEKMAFEFASDLTKQLITLSAAIVTFTVTFSKDLMEGTGQLNLTLLIISWGFHLLSILCGLLTLMALTGNLDTPSTNNPAVYRVGTTNVRTTSIPQILSFLIAIILTVCYVVPTAPKSKQDLNKQNYQIIRKTQLGKDSTIYLDTIYVPKPTKK